MKIREGDQRLKGKVSIRPSSGAPLYDFEAEKRRTHAHTLIARSGKGKTIKLRGSGKRTDWKQFQYQKSEGGRGSLRACARQKKSQREREGGGWRDSNRGLLTNCCQCAPLIIPAREREREETRRRTRQDGWTRATVRGIPNIYGFHGHFARLLSLSLPLSPFLPLALRFSTCSLGVCISECNGACCGGSFRLAPPPLLGVLLLPRARGPTAVVFAKWHNLILRLNVPPVRGESRPNAFGIV